MSRRVAKSLVIALTGHRPEKLGDDAYEAKSPIRDWVRRELRAVLQEYKPTALISGMALGFDTWGAELALEMGIPLHAYVPFEGQESRWWSESRTHYHGLLSKAAKVRVISPPGYAPEKMQKRNVAMVDDCDLLVALFDGSAGGTKNCLDYAAEVRRRTILIDPTEGIEFIERRERSFHGQMYQYLGNLRWRAVPLTVGPAPQPHDDEDLPF